MRSIRGIGGIVEGTKAALVLQADGVALRADLLLVDGDPSTQIRATRNIVAIWKRGCALSAFLE